MLQNKLLAGAAKSATYNILLQLLMRILTFAANGVIIRHVSPDLLGIANVRLMLLFTTIQFISREGFRRACLSCPTNVPWSQIINLVWCSVPVTVVMATCFGVVWSYVLDVPSETPDFIYAVITYSGCTVVEAISEPTWLLSQAFLFVKLRVVIDGVSNFTKCLVTVVMVLLWPHYGLGIFCIAQICSSLIYPLAYFLYFARYIKQESKKLADHDTFPLKRLSNVLPSKLPDKPLVDRPMALLVLSFFKQSFLKQILTEGEKYVMTIFNVLSFSDQGVFDVVSNLGSLVARFIFWPIEQEGYLFFSRSIKRGISADKQSKESLALTTSVLGHLLKMSLLFGCGVIVFGLPYSRLLLHLYGGNTLSSGVGPTLLRVYCVYVFTLTTNGITECFVFAAMSQEQIDRYNLLMVVFSLMLLLSSWGLTRLFGGVGLILANCINMSVRIVHSLYFIRKFYRRERTSPFSSVKLSPIVCLCFVIVFFLTVLSQKTFDSLETITGYLVHVAVGSAAFLIQCSVIYYCEKDLVNFLWRQYRENKEKSS